MKKIFLLTILLFQMTFVFGQSVGSIIKSKTIYNSSGITVSYTITYYGVGDCNDNINGGLKKYKIDFYAKNNSNSTIKLVGSRIDLDDNLGSQHYCRSGIYILFGTYPGFEDFGTLVPNENVNATQYVYMLQNTNELPFVTYNIIPMILPNNQSQNTPQNQNPSNTNSNNHQNSILNSNIQQALTEFNQLLPNVPDSKVKTNIYNSTQNVLNGNYSEQGKLNVLHDAISKFKNLIAQGKSSTSNSSTFKDLQNKQSELVKQIKAIEPNTNVWVYEGNIGENETLSIQRSKENINHLEKWLERIKSNSQPVYKDLSNNNSNPSISNNNNQIPIVPQKTNSSTNNRELNNILENTSSQINNAFANAVVQSKEYSKMNDMEIKSAQEEFLNNNYNLTDEEIDLLLVNPDPKNYATINIYNSFSQGEWFYIINGKKLATTKKKKCKIEYRVYLGNKLNIQTYGVGGLMNLPSPVESIVTRIRKGKVYHFLISRGSLNQKIEQLDEEPLEKKGKKYESISNVVKSDID